MFILAVRLIRLETSKKNTIFFNLQTYCFYSQIQKNGVQKDWIIIGPLIWVL